METKFAEIPDALWEQVEPLLPTHAKGPRRGRPPIPNRTILSGIVYRVRTGSQWKALPAQFGSGSACHARFQAWSEAGLFRRLFEKLVRFYDNERGADWEWASLDSAIVKAPKGGDAQVPTRRSMPLSCERLGVRVGRPICASTRATTSTTSTVRFEHVESTLTSGVAAKSQGDVDAVEPGGGSWNEPTRGTTGFAPCSFAGSERGPTTWHSSISRAP